MTEMEQARKAGGRGKGIYDSGGVGNHRLRVGVCLALSLLNSDYSAATVYVVQTVESRQAGSSARQSFASGRQVSSGPRYHRRERRSFVLQLILTAASVAIPWTQQFRRPHVVRDLEIPSGTSCRLQTPRKPAASAVIPCRSLAAAFLRVQSVGAG
jgi:hypothetical protein